MKYQVLFSLKSNEKLFINVVCCSRDWRFKGSLSYLRYNMKVSLAIIFKLCKTFNKYLHSPVKIYLHIYPNKVPGRYFKNLGLFGLPLFQRDL